MGLGVIGLGRMGPHMVRRLMTADHRCVVCDQQPQAVQALADDVVIDGGNSNDHDDIRRNAALGGKGIHYRDAGTARLTRNRSSA